MAYMSQEKKSKIAPSVKDVLNKYDVKGTLSVSNGSTLVLTLKSGVLDFHSNFNQTAESKPHALPDWWKPIHRFDSFDVNSYHYQSDFTGEVLEFLKEIFIAMNDGNHDRSDTQSDYFDIGWYVSVKVGKWNRPYVLVK